MQRQAALRLGQLPRLPCGLRLGLAQGLRLGLQLRCGPRELGGLSGQGRPEGGLLGLQLRHPGLELHQVRELRPRPVRHTGRCGRGGVDACACRVAGQPEPPARLSGEFSSGNKLCKLAGV